MRHHWYLHCFNPPPLCRRGERRVPPWCHDRGFNPPPALSARGTSRVGDFPVNSQVSIHPPLCRRGEREITLRRSPLVCFNPPPALSARGTSASVPVPCSHPVSIHPPLCRRGEHRTSGPVGWPPGFQSTPRFVGEGNARSTIVEQVREMFQSTPRFVGEGNTTTTERSRQNSVSIHPPLCRRGEPGMPAMDRASMSFNPPPLCRRGERDPSGPRPWRLPDVSIHPPLCRRGEPAAPPDFASEMPVLFQSTPRFVGEGNDLRLALTLVRIRFNPPPALSARGTAADDQLTPRS